MGYVGNYLVLMSSSKVSGSGTGPAFVTHRAALQMVEDNTIVDD